MDDTLTVIEVAQIREVSRQAVYNWCEAGLLHEKDRFGHILIKRQDAMEYVPDKPGPKVGSHRAITLSQLAKAKKMRLKGMTYQKIADKLGVKCMQTIYNHLRDD